VKRHLSLAATALVSAHSASAAAPNLLNAMFQDHAVLQRGGLIPVYGTAEPGVGVTVTLGKNQARARTDRDGHWQVALPAMPAGGPYILRARTDAGQEQVAQDVMTGDVFLCSGQSNMAFEVQQSNNAKAEIAASKDDGIRSLMIATQDSITPLTAFAKPVKWLAASPETVGAFSASCYFFARDLRRTTKVPIGMVVAAWGGSRVRNWISEPGLVRAGLERESVDLVALRRTKPEAANRGWDAVWERWWKGQGIAGTAPWLPTFDASNWKTAPAGLGPWARWNSSSDDGFTGQMWLRTEVNLTAAQAAQEAILDFGTTNEEDQAWVNGHGVGGNAAAQDSRHAIARGLLHAGRNTIVTNIFCSWRYCGMTGPAEARAVRLADGSAVPLVGSWRYAEMSADAIAPQLPWGPTHGVSVIYNGMIAPIGPYSFKAAVWYQGESDVHFAPQYQPLLQALITDWRQRFRADLPFLIVQLPNFGPHPTQPVASTIAEIREAQRRVAVADPHSDYVVTIDVGDPNNIHPTNKQAVGQRLASTALGLLYSKLVPGGPRPALAKFVGSTVAVQFTGVTGALKSNGPPGQFELCRPTQNDCRFVGATIRGTVATLPSSTSAIRPTRVRYCWGDSPTCTLTDASGLPAGPFEIPIR
jgi:sialate O-acetylesterase